MQEIELILSFPEIFYLKPSSAFFPIVQSTSFLICIMDSHQGVLKATVASDFMLA